MAERICHRGKPGANYACRFCRVPLHRSDDPKCDCSFFRTPFGLASICPDCVAAFDVLQEDTPLGRVHRAIVKEEYHKGHGPVFDTDV